MPKTFTMHVDPGHGWLEVRTADLTDVGLCRADISGYSYVRMDKLYLEEDCDFAAFQSAYVAKYGKRPQIIESYKDPTPIRSYPRLDEAPQQHNAEIIIFRPAGSCP